MTLVIISHTEHFVADRIPFGWGPTILEIDQLSQLFSEVVHVAMLYSGEPPDSCLPYEAGNVTFIGLKPSGGHTFRSKLGILVKLPGYATVIWRAMRKADAIHIRCPAGVSIVALLLLSLIPRTTIRWIKYAGAWDGSDGEPLSYRVQRWWLRKGLTGGVVTVSGNGGKPLSHVITFRNPCLTNDEIVDGREVAADKRLTSPLRLVFVGRVEAAKGADKLLDILEAIRAAGVDATLDVVGNGSQYEFCRAKASSLGLQVEANFHGWLARGALSAIYAPAHIACLPSLTEGWPKFLSEAMAYGVVPVASRVGSIAEMLRSFKTGRVCDPYDIYDFVRVILSYARDPDTWHFESQQALQASPQFGYSEYLKGVRANILKDHDK